MTRLAVYAVCRPAEPRLPDHPVAITLTTSPATGVLVLARWHCERDATRPWFGQSPRWFVEPERSVEGRIPELYRHREHVTLDCLDRVLGGTEVADASLTLRWAPSPTDGPYRLTLEGL